MDNREPEAAIAGPAVTGLILAEPRLRDLLEDEPLRLLMARDGVYREDLLALVQQVAANRRAGCQDGACAAA